ncbi:TlpA family protein disulfide reductase [Nitratifractor salsuginis]|uniref:Thioredoxin family protein n=1 Tax=Nitratifractor salsuginis (strain DSM 16511 / JCM 12458 / E9I37-1) TaxID=749222 RepID=E6X324_NITSE|nr:redoxin domain-containing protein [Nitratifractor salsuginis]ADV46168.1 thioredoxin family protein [Nitratifractor salsuginis DSM 16511]
MKSRKILLSLLIALISGINGVAAETSPASATQPAPQSPQTQKLQFTFTDTHGQIFHIIPGPKGLNYPEFKGKKVFAMFFINSGTPCRNELQTLTQLKPKLKDMEVVAFELKGLKPDQLKAFEKELSLQGIHLVDTAQALPFANFIARVAGWKGSVPLIILSDKNGEVKHMQLGAMTAKEIEDYYKKL